MNWIPWYTFTTYPNTSQTCMGYTKIERGVTKVTFVLLVSENWKGLSKAERYLSHSAVSRDQSQPPSQWGVVDSTGTCITRDMHGENKYHLSVFRRSPARIPLARDARSGSSFSFCIPTPPISFGGVGRNNWKFSFGALSRRSHPFSFRTRQLSSVEAMVLARGE